MEQESTDNAPQQILTRVDYYKIFLGKENEVNIIADFLKRLLVGYGLNADGPVRFLDAGCGLGRMFHKLAADFRWHVTGMEPDPDYYRESVKAANELRQSRPEAHVSISTDPSSFATMNSMDPHTRFDMIAAINGPFYYLLTPAERLRALRNMFAALVPGGVMLLDMANFQYLLHSLGDVPERIIQKEYGKTVLTRTMNIRLNWHASTWTHTDTFASASALASAPDCVEVHTFSITSPPDIAFLVELAGFEKIKFFNSWASDGAESEVLQGPRVMIAAQKPL